VNNFIRTIEAEGNPAESKSWISMSSGQSEFFALVIIAITDWPTFLLNVCASERINAGLRLVVVLSVNGKGTTTTSKALKVMVGIFIGC
jgi:hypothetical protein